MGRLIFSMLTSLDGYVAGPNGELDWHMVDEELHRHFNDEERGTELVLYGRRLYELMSGFWPGIAEDPSVPDYVLEYAELWKPKPKVVFSSTLSEVGWNARLVQGDAAPEVARLKREKEGVLSVGGATLGSSLLAEGLVDEVWTYVNPVVLGAGLAMFAEVDRPIRLRQLGERRFASGVLQLRYEVMPHR